MQKLLVLASIMVLTASGANCAREGVNPSDGPSGIVAPSALGESASPSVNADANGGGSGKPSGGTSSLTLEMVTDTDGNGLPNWGDAVTFRVSTSATSEPRVDLKCSQNGAVVYGATTGYFASYPWPWTQVMTLSSNAWQAGTADCTATLYYVSGRKTPILASLRFTALE